MISLSRCFKSKVSKETYEEWKKIVSFDEEYGHLFHQYLMMVKINKGLATLEDQDEACKYPEAAVLFALKVPYADLDKCEESACQDPKSALLFAEKGPRGRNYIKCENAVCKDPTYAFHYAAKIKHANISKLQEAACKTSEIAFYFAKRVSNANLQQCKLVANRDYFSTGSSKWKLGILSIQDILNTTLFNRKFFSHYIRCDFLNYSGRPGWKLLGGFHELWIPMDLLCDKRQEMFKELEELTKQCHGKPLELPRSVYTQE
jgi:hypothetical protein